ncbi:unnamed protein product [Arctogadus glacialis]
MSELIINSGPGPEVDTSSRPASTRGPRAVGGTQSVEETGLSDGAAGHAFFHRPRDSQSHSNVIGLDLILLRLREELRQSVEARIQKEMEGSGLEYELEGSDSSVMGKLCLLE